MINFEIDSTDIDDLKTTNNSSILGDIKKIAGDILKKGGKVIIKRSYMNSPDDFIKGFTSKEDFDNWWDDVVK